MEQMVATTAKTIGKTQAALMKTFGRTGLKLKKHSPEILLVVGIVSTIGGTILACRATLKAPALLEEHRFKVEDIKGYKQLVDSGEVQDEDALAYDEQAYQKDLTVAYVQTAVNLAVLYAPAVSAVAVGIGCIIGGHTVLQRRNVAIMAAYEAIEKSFAAYRNRVVDEFGEKKDWMLKHGLKEIDVVDAAYTDEDGVKHKAEKKKVLVGDVEGISGYARIFGEGASTAWMNGEGYNLTFLQHTQAYANNLLITRGHIFLNEVYDALGLKRTRAGAEVGWMLGNGDDYVTLGFENNLEFMAKDTIDVILDFNVDGIIIDKLDD